MTPHWETVKLDSNYEISTLEPHQIRHRRTKKIIAENTQSNNYIICYMSGKKYYKHRILADQFIPNPNNLPQVDHIDQCSTNNTLSNLRWVSASDNLKNRRKNKYEYEYFDNIPANNVNDIITVDKYAKFEFEDLYYCDGPFYYFNGVRYRKLYVNQSKTGSYYLFG